jgi:hypothetical protein
MAFITTEIQVLADIVTLFLYIITTPFVAPAPVGNQCTEALCYEILVKHL